MHGAEDDVRELGAHLAEYLDRMAVAQRGSEPTPHREDAIAMQSRMEQG